jgi:hypothetical protein
MSTELIVKADHFQILVGDREKGPLVDTTNLWNSAEPIPSIPGAPELIALPLARFGGAVRVELAVLADAPDQQTSSWESLGRFKLEVPSGELLFWGPECENPSASLRAQVPKGSYAGEAYACGRDQVTDEYAEEGQDRYRLTLWPAE